jgi:Phosphodiester glycosidase
MTLTRRLAVRLGFAAVITVGAIGAAGYASNGPGSTLAVRDGGSWSTWWRSEAAPVSWNDDAPLAHRVVWRPAMAGIEWGELQLQGASEAWRTRLVVVRLDARTLDLSLVPSFTANLSWTIASVDSRVVLAFDAGQFRGRLPWGWVVSGGEELLAPEYAPLAGAVVVDADGAIRIVAPDSVAAERNRNVREAFQSYPMLLLRGVVPAPLRDPGSGVDLSHRDARLALGTLVDGRVVVALTRFDALGPTLGRIPFGLTTPEMAAVMGGLGARDAILLDGGISGQLMLRHGNRVARSWPGTRGVPLGMVGRPRSQRSPP